MKKSNCKKRLTAVAVLFAVIASLGFAVVPIVVYGQLFELELPKIAVTSWIFTTIGKMFFPVVCALMFAILLVFSVLAVARKKSAAFIVIDILLLAATTVFFGALTYGYYQMERYLYAMVCAGLTICAFVAFVLSFAALCCKGKQHEAVEEQAKVAVQQDVADEVQETSGEQAQELAQCDCDEPCQQAADCVEEAAQPNEVTQRQLARLKTLLDKGVINQSQYEKLVDQFTNNK